MKLFRGLLAACLMLAAAPAFASPLAYYNSPLDTPNSAANAVVTSINANNALQAPLVACTGTTTATTGEKIDYTCTQH